MFLESSPLAGHAGARSPPGGQAWPPGLDLTVASSRSALAGAALAACVVGLLGVDAGLLWVVAGVFTVRALTGAPPGLAWGIACIGAGLRWGTLSVGDLEVATRAFGPTILAGTQIARIGMAAALIAALADECRTGALGTGVWIERATSVAAIVTLVPLFLVSGPSAAWTSVIWWGVLAAAVVLVSLALRPQARALPAWGPVALAVAGVIAGVGG